MGLITRSEAAHRLKLISSHLSCAITAAREGEWEKCSDAAVEVSDLLDSLRPHLTEAAEAFPTPPVGSLKYNPPEPDKARTGGLGYRGSSHSRPDPNGIYRDMTSGKPPSPIAFAPPSQRFAPQPRVLVTPPPPLAPPTTPVIQFDPTRMAGRPEYDGQPQSPREASAERIFSLLIPKMQEKILDQYRVTGSPVCMKP